MPIDKAAYQAGLLQCYLLMQTIAALPLAEMRAAIDRAEAVGAVVDPTLYRAKSQAMADDRAVVCALLEAQVRLRDVFDAARARGKG